MSDIDKSAKDIIDLLRKMDWAKIVKYGSVKVQVRDGQPTKITIEQTVMVDEH